MVRTVKIGNNNYNLKSSAYTMFAYKDQTGRDLLKDISSVNEKQIEISKMPLENQETAWLNELTNILELILRLTHIMIKEQDKSFKEYNEWLKDLDGLMQDNLWITEVLEVAVSPFSGRIQNSQK